LELLQCIPPIHHEFYCSLSHEEGTGRRMGMQKIIIGEEDDENAEETEVTSRNKF
jgi:hypothetical protein